MDGNALVTGVDLSQTGPLLLPWTLDPWGRKRPPLSQEALWMSAELASATYGMAIEPWIEAGWRDVTIQVDGELTALPPDNPLSAAWRKYWVRARIRQVNPLGQVLGALRVRGGGTTGKAVVMLHPAPDGRYVVAVGFMGTGTRFYDWFSNFRMTTQDGTHRGFLELARQFEGNEEKIEFPETAEELGLERLTLGMILRDMQSPNSRFHLWLCGHSQGAALMQVYAYLKLRDNGICPQKLLGYGFASPTVMTGASVRDPSAYPLYHVLNSDDLVPRCGAQVHLGLCLHMEATPEMRKACYPWKRDEASVAVRLALRPTLWRMTDTPSCIIGGLGLLTVLGRLGNAELVKLLGGSGFLPLDRVLEKAEAVDFLRGLKQRVAVAYESVTGHMLDMLAVEAEAYRLQVIIDRYGLHPFMEAALDMMTCPHSLTPHPKEGYIGTYFYQVMEEMQQAQPFIWRAGETPCRMYARDLAHGVGMAQTHCICNRRLPKAERRVHLPAKRHDVQKRLSGARMEGRRGLLATIEEENQKCNG